jgi:Helix-turn-helix domain/WD40-like Beta Propeller Repeat
MPRPNGPVSLTDLAAAGVGLRPSEAVTIAREVALQVVRGQIAGVPSPHVVRLSNNGSVSIEGPVAAGGRPVVRVAQLLDALLPDHDHHVGSEFRVPGGLKLVVARALGTLDLPPFGSLEAFVESLDRFAATDPRTAIAGLVVSFTEATAVRPPQEPAQATPVVTAQVQPFVTGRASETARAGEPRPPQPREALTISDIRRARRATGVPLVKVAERSRIPIALLRQLEWGYFFNWPKGRYGRSQLVRYARAAGLDEELVLSTVTPLIDLAEPASALPQPAAESAPEPGAEPAALAEPAVLMLRPPAEPAEIEVRVSPSATLLVPIEAEEVHHHRRRGGLFAALAAAAVVTIVVPMWWNPPGPGAVPSSQTSQAATGTTGKGNAAPTAAPEQPREATDVATAAPAPPAASEPPAAARPADAATKQPDPANSAGTIRPEGRAAEYQPASDQAFSPSFASAGTAMFYHDDQTKGASLVRADTNGDGSVLRITRIVDDPAKNYHVRLSPDGKRIAFDSDRDGVRGVYVADDSGQHVSRVSGQGYAAVPSWSPDGRTLAFARAEPEHPKVWNLWTLELESGQMRRITKHASGQPWGGSWFPDGRRIAYSHEDRLIVRDVESGAERVFPAAVRGRLVRTPTVSPDGRRIVFQVEGSGTWLLEFPAGAARKVLEDPTAEEYTWAPDGKRLAYYSRRSDTWGVWVMAPR